VRGGGKRRAWSVGQRLRAAIASGGCLPPFPWPNYGTCMGRHQQKISRTAGNTARQPSALSAIGLRQSALSSPLDRNCVPS